MPAAPIDLDPIFVGVDGGGTKCEVVVTDNSMTVLGKAKGGPANPYQDMQRAQQTIISAIDIALCNAGLTSQCWNKVTVGMGLAGVNIKDTHQAVSLWQLPYSHHVTTDLQIANLAAHETAEGAVIVIGTGSSGYSLVGNTELSLGGHGFPLGDKGSGAWLGYQAVKAMLLANDGLGPATLLSEALSDKLQAKGLEVVARLSSAKQRDFGILAPLVFEAANQADLVANSIIGEGVEYLSAMANKLLDSGAKRLSAIGGLANKTLPYFNPELRQRFSPALNSPEIGAVILARDKYLAAKSKG